MYEHFGEFVTESYRNAHIIVGSPCCPVVCVSHMCLNSICQLPVRWKRFERLFYAFVKPHLIINVMV